MGPTAMGERFLVRDVEIENWNGEEKNGRRKKIFNIIILHHTPYARDVLHDQVCRVVSKQHRARQKSFSLAILYTVRKEAQLNGIPEVPNRLFLRG